ncbi:non-ribosomal peptide synthetase [Halalkalibacterium halodurans]|uniref:non-ribosomal peptide synthetase n=1 Tax=Halalkalibacterium halodurans TaxID=86665 RepID=UPI0014192D51|nr:non-ribosomal peptide synthetase [Halalkalibacterium halodurans]
MSTMEGYPLSPQQKKVWELQNKIDKPLYHLASFQLSGELDLFKLRESMKQVLNRHEILRTSFNKIEGMHYPVQRIHDETDVRLSSRSIEEVQQERNAKEILSTYTDETINQILDIENGSPVYVEVIKQSEETHKIVLCCSALNADATTLQSVLQETIHLYSKQESRSEDDIVQYVDYSDWQEELFETEKTIEDNKQNVQQKALPYEAQDLEWPSGKNRASIQVSVDIYSKMQALAHEWNVPLLTLLLTSWSMYLSKLVNGDVNLGITIDGRRNYEELKNGMGPYAKLMKLITPEIEEKATFKEYVAIIQDRFVQLADAVEYLDPTSTLKEKRILPYQIQYVKGVNYEHGNLSCFSEEIYSGEDTYKLKLSILDSESVMNIGIQYDDAIYKAEDIQTVIRHFLHFLEECLDDWNRPFSELKYQSKEEEKEILSSTSTSSATYPSEDILSHTKNILQHLKESITLHAHKVAIEEGSLTLSYKDIDEKSNQMAQFIKSFNIMPEERIAMCLPRSVNAIISMLAILKSGASFVPIDPKWPVERIQYVLQDSGAKLIVVQNRESMDPAFSPGVPLIDIEHDEEKINQYETGQELPLNNIESNQLAYMMYTSGSTGLPKGVGIEHGGLLNYILWFKRQFSEDLNMPFISEFGFDAFLKQVFCPLTLGNKITIFTEEEVLDTNKLVAKLINTNMNALNCVPSLWEVVLQEIQQKEDLLRNLRRQLRTLLVGGEQVSVSFIQRTKDMLPEVDIVNLYGPTEATSNATFARLTHPYLITIGQPIANIEVAVLNEKLEQVAVDEIGELYIGGTGIARGYINKAKLTATQFIPHPYSDVPGMRLYKTGDLVRIRPNRQIEFIGRRDSQMKINGKRVDAREIEYTYAQHPLLESVVVLPIEEEKTLVAFYVQQGTALTQEELRTYGQKRLPQYMIPHSFVRVDMMPLNNSGKTDHRTLQSIYREASRKEYIAPRNKTEQAVSEIWREVLKVERVGMRDNFFELGGHSLNATQLISRLRRIYRVDIPISLIFETETVERLCEEIEMTLSQKHHIEEISAAYLKAKALAIK